LAVWYTAYVIHKYAITKKDKRFIDRAAYVVGIMFPVSTLPQVIQLYSTHDASSLSLITWSMYGLLTGLFLIYAMVDNIKPLIFTQIAWIFIDICMITGIIIYR